MSRKGNAVVESFFGNLQNELVHHRSFATREEARAEIFDYMELFYSRHRAHATLQYWSGKRAGILEHWAGTKLSRGVHDYVCEASARNVGLPSRH